MTPCRSVRVNDEMQCPRCGYAWDAKDPDPPKCKTDRDVQLEHGNRELEKIRRMLREEKK